LTELVSPEAQASETPGIADVSELLERMFMREAG
jgi:hypothetical protein